MTAVPHSADPRAVVDRAVSSSPAPRPFVPSPPTETATGYAAGSATDRAGVQPRDWLHALGASGRERDEALGALHALMLRAARHQMARMRSMIPGGSARVCDDIANAAADEAMTALLAKLHTFEGRSQFTTWAYKFAILQVATEVRRQAWSGREVSLEDVGRWGVASGSTHGDPPAGEWGAQWGDRQPGPDLQAEAAELAQAVGVAMREALTPYQRRIAVALLVDQVPVDVLADRLGTTRGALYKTLHMARGRIRTHLVTTGHLPAPPGPPPQPDGVGR